jgi:sulfite reductase alpha subunit-like flavoprotein
MIGIKSVYTWTTGGTIVTDNKAFETQRVVSTVTDKPKGFVDMRLTIHNTKYAAGDHLAVYPPNRQSDLDTMLKLGTDTSGVIGGDTVQDTHILDTVLVTHSTSARWSLGSWTWIPS